MSDDRTFEYLLNAFEHASQAERPSDLQYAEKRKALFAHESALRARVAELEAWAEKAEVAMVAAERLVRGSWECSEGVLSKRTHRAALADALSACPPLESLTKEVKP
jgi:hypothetical protein